MSKLIIMVGLPASGKSTYLKRMYKGYTVISTDSIRKEVHGQEECQDKAQQIFNLAYYRIEKALSNNENVVFDATNLRARNRKYLCKRFRLFTNDIVAEYINTPVNECIARDKQRSRTVGAEVIQRMAQTMSEPRLDEGFDLVHIVGVL